MKKGGICYVLIAFYISLYSRPGLSFLAVCDISIATIELLLLLVISSQRVIGNRCMEVRTFSLT